MDYEILWLHIYQCRKIPPRSKKQRDTVLKTRRRQRAGVSPRGNLRYDSWMPCEVRRNCGRLSTSIDPSSRTVSRYQISRVLTEGAMDLQIWPSSQVSVGSEI